MTYRSTAGQLTPEHYYRTGDRVRRENGALVHLGRLDNQIKLRGYRVELGEIEAAIRRHPAVTSAVVVALRKPESVELVACHTGDPLPRTGMKTWLRQWVPAHMVPQRFVRLPEIPLNLNGKIDRPALLQNLLESSEDEDAGLPVG